LTRFADKHLKENDLGFLKELNEDELKEFIISNRPEWAKDYLYERLNK
jgi:hypothetical protein